jgi:hypothetical protein
MVAIRSFVAIAVFISLACASAVPVEEEHWTVTLLKRQEPGTPAYDCHLNCGMDLIHVLHVVANKE